MQEKTCKYWGCRIMSNKDMIFKGDMEFILQCNSIDWDKLGNKTILVTGGTGLIGSTIVKALIYASKSKNLNLKIIVLVRNSQKARQYFLYQNDIDEELVFVEGSVEKLPEFPMNIDYIIHGASPTSSAFFVEHPVETINIAVLGTKNILELARYKQVNGLVYLSSMEVYGAPLTDALIDEAHGTTVNTMEVRSSYPEAKRLCECLCASYFSEYAVNTKVIRLAQTFGPGVSIDDNRVFAEFARCAINKNNIVLKTAGNSKHGYLYTADAVTAILTVLLEGKSKESYNAANPKTYCSILEMARLVAKYFANDEIKVVTPVNGQHDKKYPPVHHLNLNVKKLNGLGWKPCFGLIEMYQRMIGEM